MRKTLVFLTALALLAGGPIAAVDAAPAKAKRGPRGPRGPQGPAGPQGTPGTANLKVQFINGPEMAMCAFPGEATCGVITAEATCPAGMIAVGGGFVTGNIDTAVVYNSSGTTKWVVIAVNKGSTASSIRATAVCMTDPGA